MTMRIAEVRCWTVVAPIRTRYDMAAGTHDAARCVVVKIVTEDGVAGYGEAHQGVGGYSSETVATMAELIRNVYSPALIGREAADVSAIMSELDGIRVGNRFAKAAIDIALFDVVSRTLTVSVGQLLGGATRSKVDLVGGIGFIDVDAAAERARALVADGFGTLKLKVGGQQLNADIDLVKVVRDAVGREVAIRVDANGAYNLQDAARLARGIESCDIELLEQPLPAWNVRGMADLRARTGIPVMADESAESARDVIRLGMEGAADIVKIKIAKVGGFLPALRLIAVAEALGIEVVVGHGMSIGLQAIAETHLIASAGHVNQVGEMVGPGRLTDQLFDGLPDFSAPTIDIPKGPGLGIDVDDEMFDKYESI